MLRTSGTVAGLMLTASAAVAQVPGVPGVPTAPPVPVAAAPATGVPATLPQAPAKNIWSFFCFNAEQKAAHEAKKRKFCQSQAGRMLYGITKPLSLATGGLIGGCCPPEFGAAAAAGAEEKAGNDPAAAADKIKKLEAEAAERKAAVRYLGTVDCKRFPEAEATLISALRTDTNECVRYEAALALNRGCCCTKKTVEALILTVAGEEKDGNPAETSPRVRSAAARALTKCCTAGADPADGPAEVPLENPPTGKPLAELKTDARRVLEAYHASAAARPQLLPGEKSLVDAYRMADGPRGPQPGPVVAVPTFMPQAVPQPMPPLILTRSETPAPPPAAAPATGKRSVWDIFQATAKPRP